MQKSKAKTLGTESFLTKTKTNLTTKITNAETLFSNFVAEHDNLAFEGSDHHFTKLCSLIDMFTISRYRNQK